MISHTAPVIKYYIKNANVMQTSGNQHWASLILFGAE